MDLGEEYEFLSLILSWCLVIGFDERADIQELKQLLSD